MKNKIKAQLVSIIVPVFNRSSIVIKTLQSILNQTYKNWECIIIDDGSYELDFLKIKDFSKKDKRFILLTRPNNKLKGANSCRNYGIEQSKGEFIIFFDSDDLMDETCLKVRVEEFNKRLEFDFLVFSMGHFIEDSNCYIDEQRKIVNLSNKKTIEEFFFSKLPWNVCRPIFKSMLIKNKISFNEKIQNFQDDDFNVRILANLNPKYMPIDITDSFYRIELDKYRSVNGRQNVLNSYYEYSKTFFSILDSIQIIDNRAKLLLRFFSVLRHNVSNESNLESVYKTLDLINVNSKLSLKELSIFHFLIYLNKFYFNKKGYYKVTQFLKKEIIK
jgi:glycosyltransferase involved in cell wall biosynthesis